MRSSAEITFFAMRLIVTCILFLNFLLITHLFSFIYSFLFYFGFIIYFFLAHIFFDDAFELSDHDENESQVNRFVKLLVGTLDEAASDVHQTRMHVRAPKKYPTPYGGRLVWTLPGKTKMIAHLKDKSKIRHRKRWSQVIMKII